MNYIHQDDNRKFLKVTNQLTDFAFILIFIIALPGIIGVVSAGITLLFVNEAFLMGEFTLGTFLGGITFSLPIFYLFFLKTRKKKIWYEIIPMSYNKELSLGSLIIYGPTVLTSLVFYLFSLLMDYASFSFEFQFFIWIIIPLESLFFCRFFKILFPLEKKKESFDESPNVFPNILMKYNNQTLQRVIFKELLIKGIFDITCLLISHSIIILIVINIFGNLLYLGTKEIIFKRLKTKQSEFKVILNLKIMGLILITQSVIQFWISSFQPILNLPLYIFITALLTLKIFFILFYQYTKHIFISFQIRVKWFIGFLVNDVLTIIINILVIIYAILEGIPTFIFILISIFFLIENLIERHFYLTFKKLSNIYLTIQLTSIYAILSFFLISVSIYFQTIIFSLLSISIPIILYEIKGIQKKFQILIQNILYIIIFYEIGLYFAISTTGNNLLIGGSTVFTYFFFISLSTLSSLYRLYFMNVKGSQTKLFSQFILIFLFISFFGIFQLIEAGLIVISDFFVETLSGNNGLLRIFSPNGLLIRSSDFILGIYQKIGAQALKSTFIIKSTNGIASLLNIGVGGLISLLGYNLIIKLHENYRILSPYVIKSNKIFNRTLFGSMVCLSLFVTFQSVSGIILCVMFATYYGVYIYDSVFEFREEIQKPLRKSKLQVKSILFIINTIVSLALFIFIGLEFLKLNFTFSFIIALFALILYINFVPLINSILAQEFKGRKVINLLNASILFLIGIFLIPSLNFFLINYINPQLKLGILNWILISCFSITSFLIISIKQLKIGNYVIGRIYELFKMILQIIFWFIASALIIFNFYNLYYDPLILFSINLLILSFIFKYKSNSIHKGAFRDIFLTWKYLMSITWEFGVITLISFVIKIFYKYNPVFLIFSGLFVLGIITFRNIKQYIFIFPENEHKIEKILDFIRLLNLIISIGIVYTSINIIRFIEVNITSYHDYYTYQTMLTLISPISLFITPIYTWIIIHFVKIVKKYIPEKIIVFLDITLLLGFTSSCIYSFHSLFNSFFMIQLSVEYSFLFFIGVSIIALATLLIVAFYLEKRKIINEFSWHYINFGLIQLEIIASFSFILYSEFKWVVYNLNLEWMQFSGPIMYLFIGGMVSLLYLIYKLFLGVKYLEDHPKLTSLLLIQKNITRIIGSISISISPIILFNFELTGFSFAFFLTSFGLVFSFKEFRNASPQSRLLNIITESLIILNIFSILISIYSISLYFINLLIPESIIISFIAFWIFLYIFPVFKKYIPNNTQHLLNAIFMPLFIILIEISVFFEFLKLDINLFLDYPLISIFIGILPLIASNLFTINQLENGKYLKDKLYKNIHFIFNLGIYYNIFAIIVSIMLKYVFSPEFLDTSSILLAIFIPLLCLFIIFKIIDIKGFYHEFSHLRIILKIQLLLLWTISTLGLLISADFLLGFNSLVITITIFIETFVLFYSIKLTDDLLPKLHKFLLIIKELLIYINLISISSVIYFTCYQIFSFNTTFSIFIVLIIVSALIYSIPDYKTGTIQKFLYEIISILLFGSSIFLAISIDQFLFTLGESPLFVYFALSLIPISELFFSISLFSKKTISQKTKYNLLQKNEIILFIDFAILIALISERVGFSGSSLLISSLSVTMLLIVDYFTINLLTNRKTVILSFLCVLLYNLVGITTAIAMNLYDKLDDQIFSFILIQLPLLFGIFYYMDWANRRIKQSQFQNEIYKKPFKLDHHHDENLTKSPITENDKKLRENSNQKSSKIAPTIITNRVAQFITIHWGIIEIFFILVTLALNIYLGVKIIFFSEFSILQILLISSLIITIFTLYQPQSNKFLLYYIQTLITIGLNYLIYNINQVLSGNLIYVAVFATILINVLATKHFPINNIVKYIQNFLLLGIYYYTVNIYEVPLYWVLFVSSILFSIFTNKSYKNLTFNSIKVWTFAYFVYNILNIILLETAFASISIYAACTVGLTWQWIVFLRDKKWFVSILKTIFGYLTILSWITSYTILYISNMQIIGLISPPIMAVIALFLIFLKKKLYIFKNENFINVLIFGSIFFFGYTLGRYYLFKNYYYAEPLSLTLAGVICSFIFIFILEFLDVKIRREFSLASFTLGSILAGVFTYLILMEPVIFPETYWEIALPIGFDIALLMFYIGIGIYKRAFTKIWSIGVYAWILAPIINFIMISHLISGIDNVSLALTVLNVNISGSIILSIIICSLMYLPVIITRLMQNLNKIIYIFWIEMVIFTAWGAANLFPQSIILQIPFIFLIALILFIPIFYFYKHWNSLSILWPLIAVTNITFVINFFEFSLNWEIPIGTLIAGFYILVLGYFPNIKEKSKIVRSLIIISGYFIILGSIFALLYSFVVQIFINPTISVNITFIVISFVLLTGKYFNLQDYLIKVGHALIVIINLAILLVKTFSIIGNGEYSIFGIFLAIAFAFGTTLSFQARKYIPKVFFELIWFGMAVFSGLALFELGLTIFNIGGWASTGVLLIVATLVFFPVIRNYMGTVFVLLIAGFSLIVMELVIPLSIFIDSNKVIIFLDIIFGLESIFIISTSKTKIGILKNKKSNYRIGVLIWEFFTIIFSLTIVFIIESLLSISILSLFLIFLNIFAWQNLLITYFIKRMELFSQFGLTQKILMILNSVLILIIYITISIVSAINIPKFILIETAENKLAIKAFYSLSIFFAVLFIELYIIDRKLVKIINQKIRVQLDWFSYFAFSTCLSLIIYLILPNWEFPLFIWSILFFGTIILNQKAENKIFPELLKISNVLLINTSIFSYIWKIYEIFNRITNHQYDLLFLNITINFAIIYAFMKLKIVNNKAIKVVFLASTIFIALYCEEISRIYLYRHFILNIAVFLFIFLILNSFNIKHAFIIYTYWTIMSFSISTFIIEFIPLLYNLSTINYIIAFSFIWGSQLSLFYYLFSNQFENYVKENKIKPSVIHPIWASITTARKIFVGWMIFETFVVSISVAQLWNYLFTDQILSYVKFTGLERFFLWISIIPIVFSLIFYYIDYYIKKYEIWKEKNLLIFNKPGLELLYKFLSVIFLNISLFYHLWYVFNISSSLKMAEFDSILFNFTINLLILYIFIRRNKSLKKWQFLTSIILSIVISGMFEEYLRVFSNIGPLMSVAVFLMILSVLNTNKINLTFLVYSYWTVISFCLASFIYIVSYWFMGGFDSIISSIIWFIFLFGLFNTIFYYLLASRNLLKLEFFQKYNPYLRIIGNSEKILIPNEIDENKNNKAKQEGISNSKSKSAFLILFGHRDKKQSQKIYSIWLFAEILILSISITYYLGDRIFLNNIMPISNFIQFLIKMELAILILSIGLLKILKYIKSNNLWEEKEKIKGAFDSIWNINMICLYIFLPITITSYFHYLLFIFGVGTFEIALFDIFVFTLTAFICVYYFDIKRTKIIKENLAISLTIIIIILFMADIGAIWSFYTGLIPIGIAIFISIPYVLKILKFVKGEILEKLLFISNSIISIAILVQIDIFLFKIFEWSFALVLAILVLHFLIELENRIKILSPIEKYIKISRKISWILLSISLSSLVIFYDIDEFTLIRLFIGILLLTLSMFYENYLLFREDTRKYFKIRDLIGIICYIEILALFSTILIPANLAIEITETAPLIFLRILLITEIFVIASVLNFIDKKKLYFIPNKIRKPLDLSIFLSTLVFSAVDLVYFLILNIDLTPVTPSGTPGVNISAIMIPIIIVSIIVGIALFVKFKNRKINQLTYLVLFIEIFIYILGLNQPLILVPITFVALLLYPFIFFLEKMILLLKLIGKLIIDLLLKIKAFFVLMWNKIVSFYYKHKKFVFSGLGLIIGTVSFIILYATLSIVNNVFLSGLFFLIVFYPVSPEREEDTKPKIFALKILYRTLVMICLVGAASALIPPIPWIYTLFLLAFIGYVIWVVRRSEELYQLPIYWRFMSALGAIIDFIITALLLLFYFKII
ncbi:MAG: hypothetical protein ACTSVK_06660 [Promethearchaeota archaeon]